MAILWFSVCVDSDCDFCLVRKGEVKILRDVRVISEQLLYAGELQIILIR